MRLRTIMITVFCVAAIAPLAIFWLWPNSRVVEKEMTEVQEQHLVVATNLAAAMELYYSDLVATFEFMIGEFDRHSDSNHLEPLLDSLNVQHVCVVNFSTGIVTGAIEPSGSRCPQNYSEDQLAWMKTQVGDSDKKVVVTPVVGTERDGNVMYALARQDQQLIVGSVATDYLVTLGSNVKFGEKGHAAIVDQLGQAIFHPRKDWQDNRQNLSGISVIKKMLNGAGVGVDVFYSPALKEDMIAGYSSVRKIGWGVIVPQPISELKDKAQNTKNTALTVMAIGMALAILLAFFASKFLTAPIEQIVQAMQRIGNGELRAHEKISFGRYQAQEFLNAKNSIKNMADKLQENIDTISRHAYLDGVTGLPNRECFRVLAQEEIERLSLAGNKGAVLFLDLDGFKQVNDVYGHRAGDDMLLAFAQRLHSYCGVFMKRHARGVDNALTVLPARLGGDEFVVFLGNITGIETTTEFSDGLFTKVFGKFQLHNGVVLDVSGSVGGAIFPTQAADFDELLRLADIAMYEAKNSGKGRFCLHRESDGYFDDLTEMDELETI